jgi:hypothetical protein
MPVIIDEVVINVEVSNNASGGSASPAPPAVDRQTIINECVEQVLEILKQKEER